MLECGPCQQILSVTTGFPDHLLSLSTCNAHFSARFVVRKGHLHKHPDNEYAALNIRCDCIHHYQQSTIYFYKRVYICYLTVHCHASVKGVNHLIGTDYDKHVRGKMAASVRRPLRKIIMRQRHPSDGLLYLHRVHFLMTTCSSTVCWQISSHPCAFLHKFCGYAWSPPCQQISCRSL